MTSRFSSDPWLAESLARPTFRLVPHAPWQGASALQSEMTMLSKAGDAFFYAKLPTSEVRACAQLAAAGFAIVDTGITLSRMRSAERAPTDPRVGVAKGYQREAIPRIGERCFRWSRFHLDPKIPPLLANGIKRRWLESYVNGTRGAALYAAEVDGQVAGFLAALETTMSDRRVAVIDLLGVADEYQCKGIGGALVHYFIGEWQTRVSELRVGTQVANVQSLRLYEGCGFRIVESNYALHAHYHLGRALP